MRFAVCSCFVLLIIFAVFHPSRAGAPTTLDDFFMPGSQPGQSGQLEAPAKCDNCHGGYDVNAEPAYNWRGSMMSQAARDPLFFACLAVANQDAPNSGDLCLRCHTPNGWLGGRSVPTDGSALTAADREGVMCDFCHRSVKPSPVGTNPYPADPFYTANTYQPDQVYLSVLSHVPPVEANGMYVVDSNNIKRGPYTNPVARHQFHYSPFHNKSEICGTCHNVSNPAFSKTQDGRYVPNTFGKPANFDNGDFDPYKMYPVERTYGEWVMSAFNDGTDANTCQGCHMRAVTGKGCKMNDAPVRNDLALHDMTGGNTWIPDIISRFFPGEIDSAALAAGKQRANQTLRAAADVALRMEGGKLVVRVTNKTGHKLPSGYPEGRRIWLNVKFFNKDNQLVGESGIYAPKSDTLKHTFGYNAFTPGQVENLQAPTILDHDTAKVYEIKLGMTPDLAGILGLPAGPGFHFAVNNTIYSDNRIPPRGFTNANFLAIGSEPVAYSYADGQYWDDTPYDVPEGSVRADVTLYYQTTSWEYIKFLCEENRTNNWGERLMDAWRTSGHSAPVAMASASAATPYTASALLDLKKQKDGALVAIEGKVVTAVFSGFFYVEDDDRSSGIKVVSSTQVAVGNRVNVTGVMATEGGERQINSSSVTVSATGASVPAPLGVRCDAFGGTDLLYSPGPPASGQCGVQDGIGPNNIGLLVRTWGKVTSRGTDHFLIDDGSFNAGLRVEGSPANLADGDTVLVTGISSCFEPTPGTVVRLLRARSVAKIGG